MRRKPPCKGCNDRVAVPNCHSTCEKYLEWTSEEEDYKSKRQSTVDANNVLTAYNVKSIEKRKKEKHRR